MKRYLEFNYDIEKKYKLFNKLYFEDFLPNNIPVYFLSNKRVTGGGAYPNEDYSDLEKIELTDMSDFLVDSVLEDVYDSMLIHEMVHGYLFKKFGRDLKHNAHGKEFKYKLFEIVKKGDFKFIDSRQVTKLEVPIEYWIKSNKNKQKDNLIG